MIINRVAYKNKVEIASTLCLRYTVNVIEDCKKKPSSRPHSPTSTCPTQLRQSFVRCTVYHSFCASESTLFRQFRCRHIDGTSRQQPPTGARLALRAYGSGAET
ncbi:hypothetical protein EVAR_11446_1 [Eumeta japonica]|uniref:Uncharacterized protein n=1 Tax=Eumeta variegata TaxID=151549 RepID=A0A4C1TKP2_EUMVA|nr:hypothetical protein EVAR_11446_1 [Eumeta japonica]